MITYLLNGNVCNPLEREKIRFKAVFGGRRFGEYELTVKNITFVNEDKEAVQNWVNTNGIGVGMPFDIVFSNGKTKQFILSFVNAIFSDNAIQMEAKPRFEVDTFFEKARGLTFSPNFIKGYSWLQNDFVNIDYIIIKRDQFIYGISLIIITANLAQTTATNAVLIQEVPNWITKVSVPVGLPPGPDWGAIIVLAVKIIATALFVVTIILSFVKLIIDILNIIFPKMRQYKAIDYFHLIEKGCAWLGYSFQSSLLSSIKNLTVLPVPIVDNSASVLKQMFFPNTLGYTKGYPTSKDTIRTLEEAISQVEYIFNAQTKVINGTVIIESSDYFKQQANQVVEIAFNKQNDIENEYKYNIEEQFKRKVIVWETDNSDYYTLDDTEDTILELDTSPISLPFPDLDLISGYDEVRINFAKAVQKGDLTFVEKAVKILAKAVDMFTNGSASSKIESRKKAMIISDQFFTKTKLLIRQGSGISDSQNDFIGAKAIAKFHEDSYIQKNIRKIYTGMPMRCTTEVFFNLLQNNFVFLENGKEVEIVDLDWSEEEHYATVSYRVEDKAKNVATKILK